ncbi:DUF4139 domain-containing protein [Pseudodesulfovibrio cashew]|uniref:DUF4139 domain-containing protein n=1 Tax=Pseudodesulfovibrio cashew TaxID=2678688 RepID=A0A6I6JEE7_9BACT|nr:DUF4139 domain-containing protein [Pseudodesulfovibrio cashew]QGY38792.1 DUF4139 domain-containing protein [Pseudodesulfovibrio cashew]
MIGRKYCCVLSVLALPLLLLSAMTSASLAADIKGADLAVYNSGQALVKETRSVNLPAGLASIIFKDVPGTLDPTSVHAAAEGMTVRELQYSFVPITEHNLLKRYLGKELTVVMPDPSGADARILRKATLASMAEGPVFLVGNEVYVGKYDALLFPELPKDLQKEPSLALTAESGSAGKRDVELSYLMSGLNWRADYTLVLDGAGQSASLSAWATVSNSSGRAFSGARLKLVAGEVRRENAAPRPAMARAVMMKSAEADSMESAPVREEFTQYHVYTIPEPVSLTESGMRQIALFSAPSVKARRELVSTYRAGSQLRDEVRQNVEFAYLLENTEAGGLGQPMPAGLVRVFKPAGDGALLLAGETRVGHSPVGGEVRLPLGRAFDLSVTRTQAEFQKLGKQSYQMSWRIEVRNGSKEKQALLLRDVYPGQWKVLTADREHTRRDGATLQFALEVPPTPDGKPMTVNYTVQVNY